MKIPFSIEYYIAKARKKGYSISLIEQVLICDRLWSDVIIGKKKFSESFFYLLQLAKDGLLHSEIKKPGFRHVFKRPV